MTADGQRLRRSERRRYKLKRHAKVQNLKNIGLKPDAFQGLWIVPVSGGVPVSIFIIFLIAFVPYTGNLGKWSFFPLTIAGSYFTNRYIEKPGIKIGKNITAKLFCKK